MKKIIIALIIGCFTVYCQPPPKKPAKDHHLRLENLIYAVALSSLKVAHQMDVKRRENILKQVQIELEREREKSSVALKALEERIRDRIEEQGVLANNGDSGETGALQIQESHPPGSLPGQSSLEEKLAQLEALVFGTEDSSGLLFRVKFLEEKWALWSNSSLSPSVDDEAAVSEALQALFEGNGISPEQVNKAADSETQLEDLAHFLQGEADFSGVLSQMEQDLSFIGLTEDQEVALKEKVIAFVEKQKNQLSESASVEDRLQRLENLIYGADEWQGIISRMAGLQKAALNAESQTHAPFSSTGDKG